MLTAPAVSATSGATGSAEGIPVPPVPAPVAIGRILDSPAAYASRLVQLRGRVQKIELLVPRPADPGALPTDFYAPWCGTQLPLLTFTLQDLTGQLPIGVSSRIPCDQPPVYPPVTEFTGVEENDEVVVVVEVRVRWQGVGPWVAPTVMGRLRQLHRVHE